MHCSTKALSCIVHSMLSWIKALSSIVPNPVEICAFNAIISARLEPVCRSKQLKQPLGSLTMDYVYHITTGITQNSHDWLVFCSFVVVVFTQMPNIRPAVMCIVCIEHWMHNFTKALSCIAHWMQASGFALCIECTPSTEPWMLNNALCVVWHSVR